MNIDLDNEYDEYVDRTTKNYWLKEDDFSRLAFHAAFDLAISLLSPTILKQNEGLEFYGDKNSCYTAGMIVNGSYADSGGKKARQTLEETKDIVDYIKLQNFNFSKQNESDYKQGNIPSNLKDKNLG